MSRSGYSDDVWESREDQWAYIRYRGALASAIRGKKGQEFLKELLCSLDALPEKKLIDGELEQEGNFCALGSVGRSRGLDMSGVDVEDYEAVSKFFGISESLAREIMYENDECVFWNCSSEKRFDSVRTWVLQNLKDATI